MKTIEAANRENMICQRVHGIVQRFRVTSQQVPTEKRRVKVWCPPILAQQVDAMAEPARAPHIGFDQSEG